MWCVPRAHLPILPAVLTSCHLSHNPPRRQRLCSHVVLLVPRRHHHHPVPPLHHGLGQRLHDVAQAACVATAAVAAAAADELK